MPDATLSELCRRTDAGRARARVPLVCPDQLVPTEFLRAEEVEAYERKMYPYWSQATTD